MAKAQTSKPKLNETEIRTQYITPAVHKAGWDAKSQVREEVNLTAGRVTVRGKVHSRGPQKRERKLDRSMSGRPE